MSWRDLGFAGPEGDPVRLSDGSAGYHMTRPDDCWRPAVASCLQVALRDVPDWRLDERLSGGESVQEIARSSWELMAGWLDGLGLRIVAHRETPDLPRWIGIVRPPGATPAFCSHSVVMSRGEVLHNPDPLSGQLFGEIAGGFSFQPTKE